MNIFTTILTDSMTLNKSMSSANSLARTDDLLATAEFQKDKRDLGAKLSIKGINNIFKAEIKYSLIFRGHSFINSYNKMRYENKLIALNYHLNSFYSVNFTECL